MKTYERDTQIQITGYVMDVQPTDGGETSITTPDMMFAYVIPDGYVVITFHDDDGQECYAIVPGAKGHHVDCDHYQATLDRDYCGEDVDPDDYDCTC